MNELGQGVLWFAAGIFGGVCFLGWLLYLLLSVVFRAIVRG